LVDSLVTAVKAKELNKAGEKKDKDHNILDRPERLGRDAGVTRGPCCMGLEEAIGRDKHGGAGKFSGGAAVL